MKKIKDHKTTITGLVLAVLISIQPLTTTEGFDIQKDWLKLVVAAGIAVFGWLSSDSKPKEITHDTNNK